jgi:hypothetical protein
MQDAEAGIPVQNGEDSDYYDGYNYLNQNEMEKALYPGRIEKKR